MDGNRHISSPIDVKHKFHITFDHQTGTFIGLPESLINWLKSDKSPSIKNGLDVNKSSCEDLTNSMDGNRHISSPNKHEFHVAFDHQTWPVIDSRELRINWLKSHKAPSIRNGLDVNKSSLQFMIPPRSCQKMAVCSSRIKHQSITTASAAGNMRSDTDHTQAVYIHKLLAGLAESVGIIISPTVCGTGFRVGLDYVMTAKHVMDQIMKETPVVLTQRTQLSEKLGLRNTDVYIDFAHERNGQQGDGNHRFNFEPDIIYTNDSLDIVILKLKPDVKRYPPPIIRFSALSEQTHQGYFIGHPNADIKKTDRYKRVMLTPYDINAAKMWSHHQAGVDGFIGIDDPGRVLLHCSFGKGASGAPGFWICPNDGQAYLVMTLVRGYPDWYYDDKHPAATKVGVPLNHLVEQGVPMESIYKDMKDNAYHLWEEIFCFM